MEDCSDLNGLDEFIIDNLFQMFNAVLFAPLLINLQIICNYNHFCHNICIKGHLLIAVNSLKMTMTSDMTFKNIAASTNTEIQQK